MARIRTQTCDDFGCEMPRIGAGPVQIADAAGRQAGQQTAIVENISISRAFDDGGREYGDIGLFQLLADIAQRPLHHGGIGAGHQHPMRDRAAGHWFLIADQADHLGGTFGVHRPALRRNDLRTAVQKFATEVAG
jgi:hypothetical protein